MKIFIYKFGDDDWIAAANLDDAKACFAEITDPLEDDDIELVSDVKMDRLKFFENNEPVRTFREELQRMISAGETFPQFFAMIER